MPNAFTVQLGFASTQEPGGISALGIDPLAIMAQGVTFLVLFFLIKKYALGRILAAMERRRKLIEESLKTARAIEQKEAELKEHTMKLLSAARADADEILHKAKEQAREQITQAEMHAKKRAEQILGENQERIAQEVQKAKVELKSEVADLVSDATGAILRESLSAAQERKLIEMYLKEVL
jgi:F-type H+-transporting ATPase subunit b